MSAGVPAFPDIPAVAVVSAVAGILLMQASFLLLASLPLLLSLLELVSLLVKSLLLMAFMPPILAIAMFVLLSLASLLVADWSFCSPGFFCSNIDRLRVRLKKHVCLKCLSVYERNCNLSTNYCILFSYFYCDTLRKREGN